MKKVLMSAVLVWVGAAVLWAQTGTSSVRPQSTTASSPTTPAKPASSTPAQPRPVAAAQPAPAVDQTAKHQAFVKQYLHRVSQQPHGVAGE